MSSRFGHPLQVVDSAVGVAEAFFDNNLVKCVIDPRTNKRYLYSDATTIPAWHRGRWFIIPSPEGYDAFISIVLSNKGIFGAHKRYKTLLREAFELLRYITPKRHDILFDFESKQRDKAATRVYFMNLMNIDKTASRRQPEKTTYLNAGFDAPAEQKPPEDAAAEELLLETHTAVPTMQRWIAEKTRKIDNNLNHWLTTADLHKAMSEWMWAEANKHGMEMTAFAKTIPNSQQLGIYLRKHCFCKSPANVRHGVVAGIELKK